MGKTLHELINDWLLLEERLEYAEYLDDETVDEAKKASQAVLNAILDKTDNIDYVAIKLEEKIESLNAVKQVHEAEIGRIRKKIASAKRSKDNLMGVMIPLIIRTIGHDGVVETKSARYKLYQRWGKPLYDPTKIDEKYKFTEEALKIDYATLKKDAIDAGGKLEGVIVPRVDAVRRY